MAQPAYQKPKFHIKTFRGSQQTSFDFAHTKSIMLAKVGVLLNNPQTSSVVIEKL